MFYCSKKVILKNQSIRIGAQTANISLLNAGTDATHAEHIETIKNRCYVGVQQDGTFLPGQLGMGLVEGEMGTIVSPLLFLVSLKSDETGPLQDRVR